MSNFYVRFLGELTIPKKKHFEIKLTFSNLSHLQTKIVLSKGQLISKCLYCAIFNSPKKQMKIFDFTTMVPQVQLFSFVFWEN